MNDKFKNLNRLEFVVTCDCTGRCKHCAQGDHPTTKVHIDGDVAARMIKTVCENFKIDSLMTFGGEPLLYLSDVQKIHTAACDGGIAHREIITNGFFSTKDEVIANAAKALAQSGVNNIMLSVDAFHQETIPLEIVKKFAKAVKNAGIPIKTHPAWLVSAEDDNAYNAKTREILAEFELLGVSASEGNIIFPSGNAKKYLGEFFDGTHQGSSIYERSVQALETISVSPNGDTTIGDNIYKNDIGDIINRF